jgi:hypothetical protein
VIFRENRLGDVRYLRVEINFHPYSPYVGYAVAQLLEALHYRPKGRGLGWGFSLT